MTDGLPSDAKMQACIEVQVNRAEDITLLSRTIIKDGIAKKFKLTSEQRELLNRDSHYKSSIKQWIQDAIAKRPDDADDASPSSLPKSKPTKASPKGKPKKVEEEDNGQVSEFSSLEDDEEPKKKKARKSKGSPVTGDKESKTKSSSTKTTTTADSAETKLKKLKSLVTLCGTRKPWKKLFEDAGCPDLESGSDEQKTKARKGQISVVERTLLDLGMTQPFTKAKAAEVQREKEIKQDLEAIQVANKTERSTTRGGTKIRTSKSKTKSPESDDKSVALPAPDVKKFKQSLADFAAELNDD